jgi:large subunit ribosomal protein L24
MSLIKKNDRVKVMSGKDRGRQGKVLKVFREDETALVERLNFVKRHTKPGTKAGQQGGIVEKEAPIRLCKLMLVCPKCSKPARVGRLVLEDGERVRYCKRCQEHIDA